MTKRFLLICLAAIFIPVLCGTAVVCADETSAAPYPFKDQYKATVFGTPPSLQYPLDVVRKPSVHTFEIRDRNVPDVFWYAGKLDYSLLMHKEPAPLMFLIAGTGAQYDGSKMQFLQKLFFSAGYHVAAVTSPTHFNFIVSASRYGAAGYVPLDVDDLYRVMGWIRDDISSKYTVTGYSVAGYSLGGLHSAYLAKLDKSRKEFNFDRVLMINPAVDLYGSALRFDSWLEPESTGDKTPEQIIDKFYRQFAEFYKRRESRTIDSDTLFRLAEHLDATTSDYRTLIGASFRITSSSMVFTSDVCLQAGYLVAPGITLDMWSPLLPYFTAASHVTFKNYFEEFLYPYLRTIIPNISEEQAIENCTLPGIADFLHDADNIYVVGNSDDPILSSADLSFLKKTFGGHLKLFGYGGHCGNISYTEFAEALLKAVKL